jgi:hypothetical protein
LVVPGRLVVALLGRKIGVGSLGANRNASSASRSAARACRHRSTACALVSFAPSRGGGSALGQSPWRDRGGGSRGGGSRGGGSRGGGSRGGGSRGGGGSGGGC